MFLCRREGGWTQHPVTHCFHGGRARPGTLTGACTEGLGFAQSFSAPRLAGKRGGVRGLTQASSCPSLCDHGWSPFAYLPSHLTSDPRSWREERRRRVLGGQRERGQEGRPTWRLRPPWL